MMYDISQFNSKISQHLIILSNVNFKHSPDLMIVYLQTQSASWTMDSENRWKHDDSLQR